MRGPPGARENISEGKRITKPLLRLRRFLGTSTSLPQFFPCAPLKHINTVFTISRDLAGRSRYVLWFHISGTGTHTSTGPDKRSTRLPRPLPPATTTHAGEPACHRITRSFPVSATRTETPRSTATPCWQLSRSKLLPGLLPPANTTPTRAPACYRTTRWESATKSFGTHKLPRAMRAR